MWVQVVRLVSQEIQLLVPDDGETSVFEFVDALASRQAGPALKLLHGSVGRWTGRVLSPVYGRSSGAHPDRDRGISGTAHVTRRNRQRDRTKALRRAQSCHQAARFDRATLLELHDRLVQFDHWSKTGRIEPEAALDLLVTETCLQPANDRRPATIDQRRPAGDRWR